ncbi:hypothetical protein HOY80DRAFT_1084848 [Tuber brumale]|nr:hypothetical protein HOY80DRAFT_1084848 [Tuber brumale]
MPRLDRSTWHNIHIYASENRQTVLGGLWTAGGITNANLYSMVEIICLFSDTFDLRNESEQLVERDEQQLQPGNYYIVTNGSITVTDEVPLTRTASPQSGTRVASFRDAVRERDKRCAITRRPIRMAHLGKWSRFKAAYIFPTAYEQHWAAHGDGRWITVPPAKRAYGSINSGQNGMLLAGDLHDCFDTYDLTINPDDNYKIVCFSPDTLDYNTPLHLDQIFIDNPLRQVDQLLRWHFRQAVLTNMKVA